MSEIESIFETGILGLTCNTGPYKTVGLVDNVSLVELGYGVTWTLWPEIALQLTPCEKIDIIIEQKLKSKQYKNILAKNAPKVTKTHIYSKKTNIIRQENKHSSGKYYEKRTTKTEKIHGVTKIENTLQLPFHWTPPPQKKYEHVFGKRK